MNAHGPETSERRYKVEQSIVFRKTKEEWGALSNMAGGFRLKLPRGSGYLIVRTTEALYQACRFPDRPDIQEEIIKHASPMRAKWTSRKYSNQTRDDWDQIKLDIMRWCLKLKLVQHPRKFGDCLLRTGDRHIVEESPRDQYWGAKRVEDVLVGHNCLGELLMELREELRTLLREGTFASYRVEPPSYDLKLLGSPIETYIPDGADDEWITWCEKAARELASRSVEGRTPEAARQLVMFNDPQRPSTLDESNVRKRRGRERTNKNRN